jgi:hypothetical protein
VRPLPRYTLAVMAAFVTFELWVPLVAVVLRVLAGPTVPTAVQALASLLSLAVPIVVGLALSDYLADRRGLVKPYQPKRRPTDAAEAQGPSGNGTGGEGLEGANEERPGLGGPGAGECSGPERSDPERPGG